MSEKIRGLFIPAECLPGLDGYSNAAAGLGEASPLTAAATFVRSGLTRDTEKLTAAYRGNYIAKRIIDGPSEDATREWYTLSVPSMGEEDLRLLKKLEAKGYIKKHKDGSDERNLVITLTESGKKLQDQALCVPEAIAREMHLSPDDAMTLYQILYKALDEERIQTRQL